MHEQEGKAYDAADWASPGVGGRDDRARARPAGRRDDPRHQVPAAAPLTSRRIARRRAVPAHPVGQADRGQLRGDLQLGEDRLHLGAHRGLGHHVCRPRCRARCRPSTRSPSTSPLAVGQPREPVAEDVVRLACPPPLREQRSRSARTAPAGRGTVGAPSTSSSPAGRSCRARSRAPRCRHPPHWARSADRGDHHDVGACAGRAARSGRCRPRTRRGPGRPARPAGAAVAASAEQVDVPPQRRAAYVVALQAERDGQALGEECVVLDDQDGVVTRSRSARAHLRRPAG